MHESVHSEKRDATSHTAGRGWTSEDWIAVYLGAAILLLSLLCAWWGKSPDFDQYVEELQSLHVELASSPDDELLQETIEKKRSALYRNPLSSWVLEPGAWSDDPRDALVREGRFIGPQLMAVLALAAVVFAFGIFLQGQSVGRFAVGFVAVFLLATLSFVLANQKVIKYYGLEYPLWALVVGLLISNAGAIPQWLRPALRSELYIKTGLVLLGAEILMHRLFVLGLPGICVSWLVTPVVLVGTYWFGQRILRIGSRSLNMVISADMSVCGVSAAIATAAACHAKKEELSLAISISLTFTTIMMVVMPMVIRWLQMDPVVGGAWMGGTIDSTGAVVAAGNLVGPEALEAAATVKMIQNTLIGVIAFCVSVYWVIWVEKEQNPIRPHASEIWHRFPKFVIGFIGASAVFSALHARGLPIEALAESAVGATKQLRGWCFCLAFVCIGLETHFATLARQMRGGKPLVLYLCGQAFNLTLTFFMAWLMFAKIFPRTAGLP